MESVRWGGGEGVHTRGAEAGGRGEGSKVVADRTRRSYSIYTIRSAISLSGTRAMGWLPTVGGPGTVPGSTVPLYRVCNSQRGQAHSQSSLYTSTGPKPVDGQKQDTTFTVPVQAGAYVLFST